MLELWLCPSRKQNTARVMQALCEKTAQRILVVPEQFSHEAERMLCRAGGDTISRFAEVLSFSRLASRVFSIEGGSACEETDAGGRLLLMALAVEQVRPRLKLFGASTSRPEFLLQLLDTLEEFRAYCLRPELLRAASEKLSGALAVKTEEFALLMESYDAACANAGQDPSSRLTRLAAALETGTFAAGRQLYLDGFTDLNGVELEILTQLLAGGAEVTVALSCDSPAGGAQIFDAARDTIRSLQRAARQAGAAVQLREFPAEDEAFSPLLRALFGRGAACPALPGVCLPCAPDIETECRAAAGEILQRMEGGARWRDIAVACADPETYRPVLETVLRRAGIPAYFAGTRDLLREPVVRMLLAALEAASGGMEQEAVLAYLKSGLSPLDAAACDALENYAVIWNIQGARWEREWTMDPAGLHGRAAPPERLAELNAWRAEAIAPCPPCGAACAPRRIRARWCWRSIIFWSRPVCASG
ncbi:MAG: PD-(D/E)XK nuclease family protein [Oscillospiraceae bacterium]